MTKYDAEKIEDMVYNLGVITVALFKISIWCGMAYIIIHFAAKYW